MQEPHETPEARKRLEAWLDRYAVTPRADLERLPEFAFPGGFTAGSPLGRKAGRRRTP